MKRAQQLKAAFPIEWKEASNGPKQNDFQRKFFDRCDDDGRRLDVFVALGANRSGKTVVAGWECMAKYLRDKARSGDAFWCLAPTEEKSIGAAGGQQRDLWQALPRWMWGNQIWTPSNGFSRRQVMLPTYDGGKCVVEFRLATQDPTTFEAGKLTGVWADERLPEEIYDRLLARIIDRNAFILYSDIPEQVWQSTRLVEAMADAGVFVELFTMYDNAHNLPPGAIESAAAKMTEDQRKLRILGEFLVMDGVVYKEFKEADHTIDPFPNGVPADWPKWRVIDYGSSAPTACLWITIAPDETAYVYREHYLRNKSVSENAQMILAASGDEKYRCTYIDPHAVDRPPAVYGSSPTVADQYATAGIHTIGWPFVHVMGEHSMVQAVKFKLEHKMLKVFRTCTNTRREFRSWKYKCDKEGKPLASDVFENDNNHTLDCIKGFFGTHPCHTLAKAEVSGGE